MNWLVSCTDLCSRARIDRLEDTLPEYDPYSHGDRALIECDLCVRKLLDLSSVAKAAADRAVDERNQFAREIKDDLMLLAAYEGDIEPLPMPSFMLKEKTNERSLFSCIDACDEKRIARIEQAYRAYEYDEQTKWKLERRVVLECSACIGKQLELSKNVRFTLDKEARVRFTLGRGERSYGALSALLSD